jgi:long-chain acyl-CoA synthetase
VHALRSCGIGAGDIVAYALPNDVDIVWWPLAFQEMGVRSIALNPSLSGLEVAQILEAADAKGLVVDAGYPEIATVAAKTDTDLLVAVGGPIEGFISYDELVESFPTTLPADRTFGSPISYSSGTTGKPKGIERPGTPGDPSAIADAMKLFAQAFQITPLEGVHLASAGMHHGGCQSFYQGSLNVGQPLAIMGKFDPEATLAMIEQHQITTAYMVPTQFVRLLRLPQEVRDRYDVSSLRTVVHSAAPCPLEIKQQMMDWWGPVIWETYGGMEGAAAIAKPHRWLEKPGTVGRAVRGMQIKILDDDGNPVATGETGHVYLEPDRPTFEYRGDPEMTASVHKGKAFTLGDVGYLDEDGYLFLRDRAKDMIISGGVNIYPAEVEGALGSHPAVRDVAVIGVPDPEWGESVKAIIELEPGVEGSDELVQDLMEHCRDRLARFKCPRSVDFRASLPRTEAGKLYKRLLRDEFWRENASGRNI